MNRPAIRAATFALGITLASMGRAQESIPIFPAAATSTELIYCPACVSHVGEWFAIAAQAAEPLTGDVEIVPGSGPTAEVVYAPKFKNREHAEGWCQGYNFAAKESQRVHDDLASLAKRFSIGSDVDKLIQTLLDQAKLQPLAKITLSTEDHQTVECK